MTWGSKYIHVSLETLISMLPHIPVQLLAAKGSATQGDSLSLGGDQVPQGGRFMEQHWHLLCREDWQPGISP